MRIGAVFVLLALGGSDAALGQVPEVPIAFSSLNTGFVGKGSFTGRVAVYPDSVVVVFDSVYIEQLSDEPGLSAYHLDSLSVGLASAGAGGWRRYAESAVLTITDSLVARPAFSITDQRFVVARPSNEPPAESWIVVTFYQMPAARLVPPEQRGRVVPGTSYAHSAPLPRLRREARPLPRRKRSSGAPNPRSWPTCTSLR